MIAYAITKKGKIINRGLRGEYFIYKKREDALYNLDESLDEKIIKVEITEVEPFKTPNIEKDKY